MNTAAASVQTIAPASIGPTSGAVERVKVFNSDAYITIHFGTATDLEVFDFLEKYGKFKKDLANPPKS